MLWLNKTALTNNKHKNKYFKNCCDLYIYIIYIYMRSNETF